MAYEEDGADTLVSGSQPGPPAEHTTLSVRMISIAGLSFIYFPCILCVCVCARAHASERVKRYLVYLGFFFRNCIYCY